MRFAFQEYTQGNKSKHTGITATNDRKNKQKAVISTKNLKSKAKIQNPQQINNLPPDNFPFQPPPR